MVHLEVFLGSFVAVDKHINIGVDQSIEALADKLNDFVILLVYLFDLTVDEREFGYFAVKNITIDAYLIYDIACSVIY